MILKDLITRCTSTTPVVIGHSDVNKYGRAVYTTQRFKSPDLITGPLLSVYVRSWYIKDNTIMIECSSIPENRHDYIGRVGDSLFTYEFDEEPNYYRKRCNHGKK